MATKRRNFSRSKSNTLSKSNKGSSSRKHLIKSRKSGTKTRKMRGGVKGIKGWFKNKFSRAPKPVTPPVVTKTPVAAPLTPTLPMISKKPNDEFFIRMGINPNKETVNEYRKRVGLEPIAIGSHQLQKPNIEDFSKLTVQELDNRFYR